MARQANQLTGRDRDVLIRTIIGEAANEGTRGWAAVAHVIRNRQRDPRWPSSPAGVALQNKQFSAWNAMNNGGNNLVRSYGPETKLYQEVGQVVDRVYGGQVADETGGAVYYYAPKGMPGGKEPYWWNKATGESGGHIRIGNHKFAGRGAGTQGMTQSTSFIASGTGDKTLGTDTKSTGTGLFSAAPRKRSSATPIAPSLFPAFHSTVNQTSSQTSSALTSSLFDGLEPQSTPVGVYDNLFGAFENG